MEQIPEMVLESGEKEEKMNKRCKTCIDNDDGLCDRKGILVEDEDHCDRYRESEKPRMKKHEKKLDITPELALAAYNTLI